MFSRKNKVLLIGNGPSALEHEYGNSIDKFDGEIARCNAFETDGFEKCVGTRTDIMVAGYYMLGSKQDSLQYKFILWTCDVDRNMVSYCYVMASQKHKIIILDRDIAFNIRKDLRINPSTGLLGILWFMRNNYEVFIYGFDFGEKGGEYYTNHSNTATPFATNHNFSKEKEYILSLIDKKKIKFFRKDCQ